MDWNRTDTNCIVNRSDRVTITSAGNDKLTRDEGIIHTVNTVPYEPQIKACNILGCDYWLNVPPPVNENYGDARRAATREPPRRRGTAPPLCVSASVKQSGTFAVQKRERCPAPASSGRACGDRKL